MSSARKIAVNRINGCKSRGPRTLAGKARASRNAYRHGLAGFSSHNPALAEEVERMAKAICGGDSNPLVFEQALLIAENELLLRCVNAERVNVIERLQVPTAIPLARGDNSGRAADAISRATRRSYNELVKIKTRLEEKEKMQPNSTQPDEPPVPDWIRWPPKDRDEYEAMRKAIPDLNRLRRYEQRAWSRRKRAVRNFIAIKAIEPQAKQST